MVQVSNSEDNDSNKINASSKDDNSKTERYTIDKNELTFPIDGLKNAKVVTNEDLEIDKNELPSKQITTTKTKEQERLEELERAAYDDKDLKFIHLPDDPAYKPISIELQKLNEFDKEDLKVNTRIMMNVALSDYVIFRKLNDDGDVIENVKIFFRRVKMPEFQEYVDLQTELDDLVKRVGIVEMTYPFTLELQDKLYEYQKKLLTTARKRIRKGYDIFFKWKNQEQRNNLYDELDNNDISFNVDSAFVRLTKSPFLRRKSSPSS